MPWAGTNAPGEIVKGAVEAVRLRKDIKILLTGQEEKLKNELAKYTYPEDQIEIVNATEVIETAEPPVKAIRGKKDSSIVVAMKMVKKGEADAFVSAGSTGAVLVGGQVLVGRIKGVERPPLAPLFPTLKGFSLLIDCGANVDARPSHLVQFAKMGSIYMESVMGKKNPTVGIVNIRGRGRKGERSGKRDFPVPQSNRYTYRRGGKRDPVRRCRCHRLRSICGECDPETLRGRGRCFPQEDQRRHDDELKEQDRRTARKAGT